eukprot:UN14545
MVSITAGVLLSFWSPLNAYAIGTGDQKHLTIYGAYLILCGSVLISSLIGAFVIAANLKQYKHEEFSIAYYINSLSCGLHSYGLFGGLIWTIGTLSNSISGEKLGFALSYAIGQSAPMNR